MHGCKTKKYIQTFHSNASINGLIAAFLTSKKNFLKLSRTGGNICYRLFKNIFLRTGSTLSNFQFPYMQYGFTQCCDVYANYSQCM